MGRCPVRRSAAALVSEGLATRAELDGLDAEILAETQAAVQRAREAPFPAPERLFDNVW
jgi:TPP-dependent pyruvate/acetoin dehydrogenase alpha subunit